MISNNDREQQIAKKIQKKISKDANLQIQMTWSGIAIGKKKEDLEQQFSNLQMVFQSFRIMH